MDAKHTQGPWRASNAFGVDVYGCGYRIAMMTGGEINRDIANARLMAAAPDLLKAAQIIIAGIDADGNSDEAYDLLRAAISKATGAS